MLDFAKSDSHNHQQGGGIQHVVVVYDTYTWFLLPSVGTKNEAGSPYRSVARFLPRCVRRYLSGNRKVDEKTHSRTHAPHAGTEAEARLASARLGNLNLGVLRGDHQRAGRPQMISMAQQPSTAVVEREKRRTMLHYFDFRPPDEESAATAVIGCGISGSTTGGWFPVYAVAPKKSNAQNNSRPLPNEKGGGQCSALLGAIFLPRFRFSFRLCRCP